MLIQGEKPDDEKIRKIEPEAGSGQLKNIMKVAHGKVCRVILTEDNRVWFTGYAVYSMLGYNDLSKAYVKCLHEVTGNLWGLDEGAKIVDICSGKQNIVVVSDNGKVYATGSHFYRYFEACRSNTQNNGDYPFELKMQDGFKAKNVWAHTRVNNVFVNCVDAEGRNVTFGSGQEKQVGTDKDGGETSFKPLSLPDGTYMTQIIGMHD